jgi:sn-glycerol 3-phosphate transport system substrate-binding protein
MVDNDNGRGDGETAAAAFDNEATVELVNWAKEMVDDGLLNALPYRPGEINHYLAMSQQNASMTIETSTAATSIAAFLGGDESVVAEAGGDVDVSGVDTSALDIGAAEMPGVREAGRVQIGGSGWYITNTTPAEVQAAAWDFIKWWNRPETQVRWHIEGSYMPFSKAAADDPEVRASWQDGLAGEWLGIAYRQFLDGVDPDFPGPLIGPYDQVRNSWEQGLAELVLQGRSAQDMVSRAADQTTSEIERYNREAF